MDPTIFIPVVSCVTVLIIILVVWGFLKYHFSYWANRGVPHIKPSLLKGNMQDWITSKHFIEIFRETYEKYKDEENMLYAGFFFNMQKSVICLDLDFVKNVLVDHFEAFENRGFFHSEKHDPLTGNLFLLDAPEWRALRTKLKPTFAANKMQYIFPTMLNTGEDLEKVFSVKIAAARNGIFNIDPLLRRYSCDVIANCVFGVKCESMQNSNAEFFTMLRKFLTKGRYDNMFDDLVNAFPWMAKNVGLKTIPQNVHVYFMKMIKQTIEMRERLNIRTADYLDVLMEHQRKPYAGKLTTEELASQVFVFLMTAYDTCASTLSYALYELARSPYVQHRLRQEINRSLKANKHKLTYESLKSMKYLNQVISETLRKHPPIPAVFRKCTKSFLPANASNVYIEPGCLVIIPTYSIHYDTRYFRNPYNFNPERFTAANTASIYPFSYLPFGEGPRQCIGMRFGRMHVGIGLVNLLKRFKYEFCGDTKEPLSYHTRSFNLIPESITLRVTKL